MHLVQPFVIRLLLILQEIQEMLLPPSVRIYCKKVKTSQQLGMNGGVLWRNEIDKAISSAHVDIGDSQRIDNGRVTKSTKSALEIKNAARSSSPYPNV